MDDHRDHPVVHVRRRRHTDLTVAENLKPTGLPYGENKRAATAQRAAGLPTSGPTLPTVAPGAAPVALSPSSPRPSPLRPGPPSDDPLMALNPATPLAVAPTREQRFQQIAQRSTNPLFRLIAARLGEP